MKHLIIIVLAIFCTACNSDWRKKYDELTPSQNGLTVVRKGDKYGLVNAEGTVVTPLKYDYINAYPSDEMPYYDVTINDLYGILTLSGEELIAPQYQFIWYSQGVFIAENKGKKQLLSIHNETLTPCYDDIGMFFSGLAVVKQGNQYGYLNVKGEVVLSFVYEVANPFNERKKAIVKRNGKWGMIDNQGNTVLSFNYDDAEPYTETSEEWEENYYRLLKDGKEVVIDKNGNLL